VTVPPFIDWSSPWSFDVTVTVQVACPAFQSIDDGVQVMLVDVPVVTVKLDDEEVELDP
jgi:hypothetical protein